MEKPWVLRAWSWWLRVDGGGRLGRTGVLPAGRSGLAGVNVGGGTCAHTDIHPHRPDSLHPLPFWLKVVLHFTPSLC